MCARLNCWLRCFAEVQFSREDREEIEFLKFAKCQKHSMGGREPLKTVTVFETQRTCWLDKFHASLSNVSVRRKAKKSRVLLNKSDNFTTTITFPFHYLHSIAGPLTLSHAFHSSLSCSKRAKPQKTACVGEANKATKQIKTINLEPIHRNLLTSSVRRRSLALILSL
jgi:hypothetical protein